MRFRLPVIVCALVVAYCYAAAAPAHAATVLVTPGRADADDADVTSDDTVVTNLEANRSYECSIRQRRVSGASEFITFSLEGTDPDGDPVTFEATGNMTPTVAAPVGASSLRSRIAIIAEKTGAYTLGVTVPSATIATVRCAETTLFGDFNTYYAEIPVVELSNSTGRTIETYITVVDFGDNVLVNRQRVQVRANQRVDTVFASIAGSKVGNIFVIHTGTAGGITGWVAEYNQDGADLTLRRERRMEGRPALP